MKFMPFSPQKLRRRVFWQLVMLALQFVLGMLLNFIGTDTKGTMHTIYMVILALHVINAIGLLEGAWFITIKERNSLSRRAAIAITVTLIAGILTTATKNDIWSFIMAIGFMGSSWLNGMLYLQADRKVRETKN